ncbi:uncharacterized protein PAC_05322 [Phialocephala subalpina]|uniref:Fungal lipase-type domain-containing protein n=1 Tax=Phialocephala subalpina TaxID=576137 RepID=A0A1L7WRP0_9HELO|nr:uncharacterized protein PAC_05322 [Phialocephala subalpina]
MRPLDMMLLALSTLPPLALTTPTPPPDPIHSISEHLLSKLDLYSQYCSSIYCDNNNLNGTGTPITCSTGSCMVAIDPSHKTIIIAFRGSDAVGEASKRILDLIPCSAICENCHCHHGYYLTWLNVRDQVIALVTAARKQYPGYEFVITGHSLGATQALFAAAEFRTNGTAAALYDYGQPHAGDEEFARYVTEQGNNYRVTHMNDAAPQYESPSLGYRHVSPEYWIYQDRNVNFTVAKDQIRVIYGINSTKGNEAGPDGVVLYDGSAWIGVTVVIDALSARFVELDSGYQSRKLYSSSENCIVELDKKVVGKEG